MKKKFMIVSNNHPWAATICAMVKEAGFKETMISSHEKALENFLEFSPTHVLVGEYEGETLKGSQHFGPPLNTWKDLSAAAESSQKLFRCGFMKIIADDFIRLPFNKKDFLKLLLS
jgi:hypothetical protein